MEARALYEIAPSLGISPEGRDRIEKAGQGEGLLVTTGRRVWVNLYGHTSPGEFAMANTDVVAGTDVDEGENSSFGRNGHAAAAFALLRVPADLEVGVAVPVECIVPLAIAAAVLVGAGVLLGQHFQPGSADHLVVRVIDDGAGRGPKVISTQTVPLR